jgi:hypothetical protein
MIYYNRRPPFSLVPPPFFPPPCRPVPGGWVTWAELVGREVDCARAGRDVIAAIDLDGAPITHAALLEFAVDCRSLSRAVGLLLERIAEGKGRAG